MTASSLRGEGRQEADRPRFRDDSRGGGRLAGGRGHGRRSAAAASDISPAATPGTAFNMVAAFKVSKIHMRTAEFVPLLWRLFQRLSYRITRKCRLGTIPRNSER